MCIKYLSGGQNLQYATPSKLAVTTKMRVAVLLLIAAFLSGDANAQIPIPCANLESLTTRTCCPVPDSSTFEDAGPCGVNLGRGSCQPTAIPDSDFDPAQTDVRMKWPIQYFNSTCVCNERFGGYDCGECSYAYNDGSTVCIQKTTYPRIPVGDMSDIDWENYREALMQAKLTSSRYKVVTINFTTDLPVLIDSMVNPTIYDLFIWMHHMAAKDNDITVGKWSKGTTL